MKYRTTEDIRSLFLDFFAQREHPRLPSHPLIPADDPTLLFVNAGMVQFKDAFTGRKEMSPPRATTSQKCLRVSGKHNDLENVGRTARHHTFFEMLGNFSFGDYFKEGAIQYAWEFLTDEKWIGLETENLWVTVHPDDEEARGIWRDVVGVRAERILDDPENFWSMGDTGPCGYCSEIHIDQGPELSGGKEVPFGEGGDRYLEIWNLVFMQYDRDGDGNLTPLPKPSIDTGMGLERIAAIVQGKQANYDIDLFSPIFRRIETLSGKTYAGAFASPENPLDPAVELDVAFRVIADHARTTVFLITDGIYPENEGRGYVLRRVMRRAIRFGRKLGLTEPFFATICAEVAMEMGGSYPELMRSRDVVQRVVHQEELRFGRTLADGLKLMESELSKLKAEGSSTLSGKTAFTLYDTHGFPIDLTRLIAAEAGVDVDEAGFETAMESQRARGRGSWKGNQEESAAIEELLGKGVFSTFVGYGETETESQIVALVVDGVQVESAKAGDKVEIILDKTPFYGESGGQVGDVGSLVGPGGAQLEVTDTVIRGGQLICHIAEVVQGVIGTDDVLSARIDTSARDATRRNHSATHLVHWALREVLGEHVKQRGSLVGPERLRFDFSHFEGLTIEETERVERLVNERVLRNVGVATEILGYDAAVAKGATAFFGEKYEDSVRVVSMAESMELCGGTHVQATGDIGLFKIVSEGGISSGVRRIEAATGMNAVRWAHQQEESMRTLAGHLKTGIGELETRILKLLKEQQELSKANEQLKSRLAANSAGGDQAESRELSGVPVRAQLLHDVSGKDLRGMSDAVRDAMGGKGVLFLGSESEGKVGILVRVSPDLTDRIHAGNLVRELAPLVGGRGGGKPEMAQAGGTVAAGLEKARAEFFDRIEDILNAD